MFFRLTVLLASLLSHDHFFFNLLYFVNFTDSVPPPSSLWPPRYQVMWAGGLDPVDRQTTSDSRPTTNRSTLFTIFTVTGATESAIFLSVQKLQKNLTRVAKISQISSEIRFKCEISTARFARFCISINHWNIQLFGGNWLFSKSKMSKRHFLNANLQQYTKNFQSYFATIKFQNLHQTSQSLMISKSMFFQQKDV